MQIAPESVKMPLAWTPLIRTSRYVLVMCASCTYLTENFAHYFWWSQTDWTFFVGLLQNGWYVLWIPHIHHVYDGIKADPYIVKVSALKEAVHLMNDKWDLSILYPSCFTNLPPSKKLHTLSSLLDTRWNVSLMICCCISSFWMMREKKYSWMFQALFKMMTEILIPANSKIRTPQMKCPVVGTR